MSKYGKLTILEKIKKPDTSGKFKTYFKCECACGNIKEIRQDSVLAGVVKSCGCLLKESNIKRFTRHGHARDKNVSGEYRAWQAMKARCLNPNTIEYEHYGGRGIKICNDWLTSFDNFLKDVGPRPSKSHTLDRVDVNGNYTPDNCRWATYTHQNQNARFNDNIELNGQTKCLSEWARTYNISCKTVWSRIYKYGWSPEEALTIPVDTRFSKMGNQ